MFMSSLQNALIFTVHTIFTTYIMIVIFMFLLQATRADFRNPLAHFAAKATNPILIPLRKILPIFGRIDLACILLAIVLQALALYCIVLIKGFSVSMEPLSILGLILWSIGEIIDLTLLFVCFVILLQVITTWIQQGTYNTNLRLLENITAPFYRPLHKILPIIGGLDFSPLVLLFLIFLCRMLIVDPIIFYGKSLI